MATVQEHWLACLPEEKDRLFDSTLNELEMSYVLVSVSLNDALTHCQQGKLLPAREQAQIFAELFKRMASRLRGLVRALVEHGRDLGTLPDVAPLDPDYFRSARAQQLARNNGLVSLISLRERTRFFRKLGSLEDMVLELQKEAREITGEIAEGTAVSLRNRWKRLEVLHYDLNTCLREAIVVLKSFFCVLPSNELPPFRRRLLTVLPAAGSVRSCGSHGIGAKIARGSSRLAARQTAGGLAIGRDQATRFQQHLRNQNKNAKDNLRSRDRIPFSRMRPDGTGGPNETN